MRGIDPVLLSSEGTKLEARHLRIMRLLFHARVMASTMGTDHVCKAKEFVSLVASLITIQVIVPNRKE